MVTEEKQLYIGRPSQILNIISFIFGPGLCLYHNNLP